MAFQLAPYNNAMRLGQGFNSYTQQICIDDAVIIDPQRAENVLTNDGSTMRIMVQSMGKPSAWSRQKEIVVDDRAQILEAEEGSAELIESNNKEAQKSSPSEELADPEREAQGKLCSKKTISRSEDGLGPANVHSDTADKKGPQVPERTQEDKQLEIQDPEQDPDTPTTLEDEAENNHSDTMADPDIIGDGNHAGEKSYASSSTHAKLPSGVETTAKPLAGKEGVSEEAGASTVKKALGHARRRAASAGSKVVPKVQSEQAKPGKSTAAAKNLRHASANLSTAHSSGPSSKDAGSASAEKEKQELMAAEKEHEAEEKALRKEREKEMREAEKERKEEEKRRREETRKLVEWGASTVGYTKEELEAMKHNIKFEERFMGMLENKKDFEFDATLAKGPSQIVTYTSRFVDKLSDVTDDMNISGSLSIKAGKFGGSGRGAFVDSDKFKSSDLNFYISVKVVNQTINFKDALTFNPIRSVNENNFREVFGDSFISGFQEGGEFNALVSMKILNKAKKTDIQAEAKIAFTAGPVDLKAEANVNIAKANIETNTETTIQVSWSGGGHIKPREQQWDIQSLMQAAARFPDLVAECPQRTYAIITKYDTLRSFANTKPAAYTKLQYENAQLYTNAMMDAYMSYKSLYTKVSSYIFDVQSKAKTIRQWSDEKQELATVDVNQAQNPNPGISKDKKPFLAAIAGLEDAKKAIRRQMATIVNEVDLIEKDPKLATDDSHPEPYQSPAAFEERIPVVEAPERPKTTAPLGGKRIMAPTQPESDPENEGDEEPILLPDKDRLSAEEEEALSALSNQRPTLRKNLRIGVPIGSQTKGVPFNNLEFLQPEWELADISVEIVQGAVAALRIRYDNGLIVSHGKPGNGRTVELSNFSFGERIIAVAVQTGKGPQDIAEARVISLHLHTNRGRGLFGQAAKCLSMGDQKYSRDDVIYSEVLTRFYDIPFKDGNIKGLWGRSDDTGIWRLGLIWGDLSKKREGDCQADNIIIDQTTTVMNEETAKAQEKLQTITAQYAELKNSALLEKTKAQEDIGWGGRQSSWRNDRVQIYFILFGGEFIWDDNVAQRLIAHAQNQTEFDWDVGLFGRDTWYGVQKSGAVLYRYNNAGEMRCLMRRERQKARFDPF